MGVARVRGLAELGLVGRGLERCRASGLAPGKRQQASAVQGLRLAGWEGAREERGRVGVLRTQGEL